MNIARDLLCIAKGEILEDGWSRHVYSVDASHYEIEPARCLSLQMNMMYNEYVNIVHATIYR